jgi:hypothetical protein
MKCRINGCNNNAMTERGLDICEECLDLMADRPDYEEPLPDPITWPEEVEEE